MSEVLAEHENGLVIIAINRPEARNAVNRAVSYGVCAAVDELDARDDLRVGILTGAGGTFCSGMDLKAFLRGEVTRVEGRGILGIAMTPPRSRSAPKACGAARSGSAPGRASSIRSRRKPSSRPRPRTRCDGKPAPARRCG
jgi:enoyl-CoA hydratase